MNPIRKTVAGAAMVAAALGGGAIGASLITAANADTASTSTTAPSSQSTPSQAPPQFDPSKGGHVANGITEELLTGDTAEKVKAAALAAVPGGTIQRVENDAEGATYEAHVLDGDGNPVTVKLDASFEVTSTEDGPDGPGGHRGPPTQVQSSTTQQG
jgi:uncharacterized membrane protein YkoI